MFPDFNIHNLVFALSSIDNLEEYFDENIVNDLSFLDLPKGRSELIPNISSNVIIDYAHNPAAFNFFLSSLEKYFENLVVVFGCGGNRDKSKGEKSIVSLRPERAIINPEENMDNKFNGKIEEVIYHGDHTRVRLNLLGNKEFILKVPNSSARMDIKLDNNIKVGWNSFDARALDPK